MYGLIILVLFSLFFYQRLKKILNGNFMRRDNDYQDIRNLCGSILKDNEKLEKENGCLEKTLAQTLAIYDFTGDICRPLETDKVFNIFKEKVIDYLGLGDCRFIQSEAGLSGYRGYDVLALKIYNQPAGYLATTGLREQDKEKFHILTQQFLLGINRAILYSQVQELSITDGLVNTFSRRYCLERFGEEINRSKKFKYNLSFLMIDIDHFKEYNDRYGHLVGDVILRQVAGCIKDTIRQIDLVGRYGGEEFCVVLVETDKENARLAAQRIRKAIEELEIRAYDEGLKVTISIGIATFPQDGRQPLTLIEKSDQALYRAKETGRNKVCVYGLK